MSLTKDTFDFLNDLSLNNSREWFLENKHRYDRSWQEMKSFVGQIIEGLASFDPYIHKDIDPGKCLFRIYRDVRFRKDKTPYKTWLGAGISVNGRKLQGPEYYIHIQPDHSFLAVGYWRPEKEHLAAIRQEIDYQGEDWENMLLQLHTQAGEKVVPDREDTLKRPPAGFSADHPQIQYLKLKSFTLSRELTDLELMGPRAVSYVLQHYQEMLPFKNFIHRAIGDE